MRLVFLTALSIVTFNIISCSKDDTANTDPVIADKLVGNFKVTEHAETVFFAPGYLSIDTVFHSRTIKINDSTIQFIDTCSTPRRFYGGFSWPREIRTNDRLLLASNWVHGNYSENYDTLTVAFLWGVSASEAYIIRQKWVRE